jgi:hypothetical protein
MPSQSLNLLQYSGLIIDPTQTAYADATGSQLVGGHSSSEQLVDGLHGKHYIVNYRGKLFEANAGNIVIPVVANNLVSVFSLINPPSSGVNAEMVDVTIGLTFALAVVDAVGWYYSPATSLFAGTFTTPGTANSGEVANNPPNKVLFYSAYTHSGTPKLVDTIGQIGATAITSSINTTKFYDGRLILPPGVVISLAVSTTVGVAATNAFNVEARWCEWPV